MMMFYWVYLDVANAMVAYFSRLYMNDVDSITADIPNQEIAKSWKVMQSLIHHLRYKMTWLIN